MTVRIFILAQLVKVLCRWLPPSRQIPENRSLPPPKLEPKCPTKNNPDWVSLSSLTPKSRMERYKFSRVYLHTVVSPMALLVSHQTHLKRASQLLCLLPQIWFQCKHKQTYQTDTHRNSKPRKLLISNLRFSLTKQPCPSSWVRQKNSQERKAV